VLRVTYYCYKKTLRKLAQSRVWRKANVPLRVVKQHAEHTYGEVEL
jgi:hypothetical protein